MDNTPLLAWIFAFMAVAITVLLAVLLVISHRRLSRLLDEIGELIPGGGFGNETPASLSIVLAEAARKGGGFRGVGPRGYRRRDEKIQDEINDRLTDAPDIDASDIEIEVQDGVVTLKGFVDRHSTIRRVKSLVELVSGVKGVKDELQITGQAGQRRAA